MRKPVRRFGLCLLLIVLWLLLLAAPGLARGIHAQGSQRDQERPALSGVPAFLDTTHFRVHYTTGGADALPTADADGSGLPDYAEFVARTLEEVWRVEVDELGWSPPPSDNDEGGDARYDVYIYDIFGSEATGGDVAGYMDNFGGTVGDNLNTPGVENRASYSYLALDNDYLGGESFAPGLTVEDYLRVTAAHEYHHAIQVGYDGDDPHQWLYEATSSWMESEVYPQVFDNVDYVDSVFKSTDTCLVGAGGDRVENDAHWYGMWTFLQALDQTYGPDVVRAIWEQTVTLDGYLALDRALAAYGDTLEAAVLRFAVRNLLRDYERIHAFPVLRLEGTIRAPGEWTPPVDGVQGLGTDFVELALAGRGPVTILVSGDDLDVRVVGVAGSVAEEIPLNGGGAVDLSRYERAYLLITSLRREEDAFRCQTTPYTVTVTPGGTPAEAAATYPVTAFIPPREEALADPGSFGAGVETAPDPAALDVPFTVLLPGSLPPGYSLADAYTLSADEFGDGYESLIPGGGVAAALDYTAADGSFIGVTQSESPWESLDNYLVGVGPSQGEVETSYGGLPALLAHYDDEQGPWTVITLIVGDLFVIVEGDAPTEAIEALAGALLP